MTPETTGTISSEMGGTMITEIASSPAGITFRKTLHTLYQIRTNIIEGYRPINIINLGNDEKDDNKPSYNKGGRPYKFPIELSEKWFKELSIQPDFQHSGGKPHIKLMIDEIILKHQKAHKKGDYPTFEAIEGHLRKLRKERKVTF